MGNWAVALVDENGNEKEALSDSLIFDNDILHQHPFKLIKYLDPWGNTTFNINMMDDVILDLAMLEQIEPSTSRMVYYITELAKKCKEKTHTYLIFYGD